MNHLFAIKVCQFLIINLQTKHFHGPAHEGFSSGIGRLSENRLCPMRVLASGVC